MNQLDIQTRNPNGSTHQKELNYLLRVAAEDNRVEKVANLLAAGANYEYLTSKDLPLYQAVVWGTKM